MLFKPRKQSLNELADKMRERGERPLYQGVVQRKLVTHYGEAGTISLPLVRWIDKK